MDSEGRKFRGLPKTSGSCEASPCTEDTEATEGRPVRHYGVEGSHGGVRAIGDSNELLFQGRLRWETCEGFPGRSQVRRVEHRGKFPRKHGRLGLWV
jgi:hypothetical protein